MKENSPNGHVLMVVNTYAPDDPRVIFSAASLVKMGYKVRLIGVARQRDGGAPSRQMIDGVDVWIIPTLYGGFLASFKMLWNLMRGNIGETTQKASSQRTGFLSLIFLSLWILRLGLGARIDVVHGHDLSPMFSCWLVARLKHARLIYDIHENVPSMYSGRKGRIMSRLERFLVPRTDVVISAGERLAREMPHRGAKKVIHIGNWKRLEEYDPSDKRIEELRQEHQLPADALIISHIGTLDPNRELPPLLEAIAKSPDVILLIGGRGHDEYLVMDAAERFPNIRWLGWVDLRDIPAYTYLSHAIYYCRSPFHFGGSYDLAPAPNKLYEAFAAGVPLIARRGVGELGEILEQIPAAVLLDETTTESIQYAFQQLCDPQIYASLRSAALSARDDYNWGVAEEGLQAVYDEMMGKA